MSNKDKPTIALGQQTVTLTPPVSPSLAMALVRLARQTSPEWAGGAAIVACCPQMAAAARVELNLSDLAGVGQRMYDWLVSRVARDGVTGMQAIAQVSTAGAVALNAVMEALPTEVEVKKEVGNSESTP